MNLIESTKRLLTSYRSIMKSIENIKDQIKNMEYTGIRPSKLDGMPHNPSGESVTEIEALIMISKKEVLRENLKKNKTILRVIDRSLETLTDIEKQVIVGYYIENKTWDELSKIVTYSPRNCMRIRNNALTKMSGAIYGHFDSIEK